MSYIDPIEMIHGKVIREFQGIEMMECVRKIQIRNTAEERLKDTANMVE